MAPKQSIQEQAAEAVAEVTSPESFDVLDWLGDTAYADDSIEIYNNGPVLKEIGEIQADIANWEEEQRNATKNLLRQPGAITDEEQRADELIEELRERVSVLYASLKGTGATFNLLGLAPVKRDLERKKIAKSLKPAKPKFEDIDGEKVLVEEGHEGGLQHPEFDVTFENWLVANSISSVTRGGKESPGGMTPEKVAKLRETLHTSEFRRLAAKVYDLNYFSVEIDQAVTSDFS